MSLHTIVPPFMQTETPKEVEENPFHCLALTREGPISHRLQSANLCSEIALPEIPSLLTGSRLALASDLVNECTEENPFFDAINALQSHFLTVRENRLRSIQSHVTDNSENPFNG